MLGLYPTPIVEGGLEGGSGPPGPCCTGSPCLLYTTTPAGLAPQDRDLVTLDTAMLPAGGRLARLADLAASDLGSVEFRDLEARRGSVRGW